MCTWKLSANENPCTVCRTCLWLKKQLLIGGSSRTTLPADKLVIGRSEKVTVAVDKIDLKLFANGSCIPNRDCCYK